MKEIIITIILSLITMIAGWHVGRRKTRAETQGVELINVQKVIKIWEETSDKLSTRVAELEKQITELVSENNKLRGEVKLLEKKIKELTVATKTKN